MKKNVAKNEKEYSYMIDYTYHGINYTKTF